MIDTLITHPDTKTVAAPLGRADRAEEEYHARYPGTDPQFWAVRWDMR